MRSPPSLREIALQQGVRHANLITGIGCLPYRLVKPLLSRLGPDQLALIEKDSPHIVDESDELWRDLIARVFKDRRIPTGSYRKTYYQYCKDKEDQLGAARERLKLKQEQYNQDKRAAAIVALSERDIPVHQRGPPQATFKSRTMQSVAKRMHAHTPLRRPPLPAKLVRVESTPPKVVHPQVRPIPTPAPSAPGSPSEHAGQKRMFSSPPPRPLSVPPSKRKRISPMFIPRR